LAKAVPRKIEAIGQSARHYSVEFGIREDVADHFGKYARFENPELKEHRAITISRAYWADAVEVAGYEWKTKGRVTSAKKW
jgi:hypothetical protein